LNNKPAGGFCFKAKGGDAGKDIITSNGLVKFKQQRMKTKEGEYEKNFNCCNFDLLRNTCGRSTGWVCLANL
jgi:hypothetical protein